MINVIFLLPRPAAGHGIVRFNKKTRKITIECWRRGCDVTKPEAGQFAGWPITVDQLDNYGRPAVAYLPTLRISGQTDPVVQVIDESNDEIVYTLRIRGRSWRPKVFTKSGAYTVKVGEPATAVISWQPSGARSGSKLANP